MSTSTVAHQNRRATSCWKTPLPSKPGDTRYWANLKGSAAGFAIAAASTRHPGLIMVVTPDTPTAYKLEAEIHFYARGLRVLVFPDWETLPYDVFSPHQDIISQRLTTLSELPQRRDGVVIVPISTLMQRLPPRRWIESQAFLMSSGERLDIHALRATMEQRGYRSVPQVTEHGEYAVRGALLDVFPMGSEVPYRIDLFDDEVESIRTFDPETQLSVDGIDAIQVLPAREFPLEERSIARFRRSFRANFQNNPQRSPIYQDVSAGMAPGGIEYYLPLFFESTDTLFDFLPPQTMGVVLEQVDEAVNVFWEQIESRYEQRRHNVERPLLAPNALFLECDALRTALARMPLVRCQNGPLATGQRGSQAPTAEPPPLHIKRQGEHPLEALAAFLEAFPGRVLIASESPGRREILLEQLLRAEMRPARYQDWSDFLNGTDPLGICVAPMEEGLLLSDPALAVVCEAQLEGERAQQTRRRSTRRDLESIISNLNDLAIGAPVVHEQHGVGRYQGLEILDTGEVRGEYLVLAYAGGDRLYVPVSSLDLVGRYTGGGTEHAPLHRLGSEQWKRARRKAAERARDAAAELLDIYARRAARPGRTLRIEAEEYRSFAEAFPFEETADQAAAIAATVEDLSSSKSTDRVVCGDVGFGKTEVAMRAAFVAVQGGHQVGVLVPTTLLAQQHYQNFIDRFADWPVRIEALSRFRSRKQQDSILEGIASGTVDIVIGTHKLLQPAVSFKRLGLVIVDEEHRFGVRHKERLKALRSEVDILTLTATPIPRTLDMALSGLRDLSIIATPPAERLAVKTFVGEWSNALVQEACLRELKRGGQVYFVHNEVQGIERMAQTLREIVPQARIAIAHGQMRERDLEEVMLDFYHQRCNVLVCTTIIESGIDIPSANTIIINRADRFGLAQLHQLRGRVGRSHHRAYAYLMVPEKRAMTADAVKRLEAIESLEDLGAGFVLATHDLEIRGAGELLGEEQSGQIQEIGFSLYSELLERAVAALKAGDEPELEQPLSMGSEIDLQIAALLPSDYLPDVHTRLIMYKRIAGARNQGELEALQVEMIDRFGLLPVPAKALFRLAELKLMISAMGIRRVDAGPQGGRIHFGERPHIDFDRILGLIQQRGDTYRLDGQDRLRFTADLPDAESRINTVHKLLESISP